MITKENFREKLKGLNTASFPADLKELHSFVIEATENGTNWNAYNEEDVKFLIDTYFEKLNKVVEEKPAQEEQPQERKPRAERTEKPKVERTKKERKPARSAELEEESDIELVERIPEEIRFIRRFLSFNGKRKAKEDFLRFINAMHKAIIEKRIRKSSKYAAQINYIQENLLKTYNSMTRPVLVEINAKTLMAYKELVKSEKVLPSVALIKRYINLNGKYGVKDKATALMDAMKRAFDKGLVRKSDKYIAVFDRMYENLKKYTKNKEVKILDIEETELNGLNGVLESCGCQTMNGIEDDEDEQEYQQENNITIVRDEKPKAGVMNSMAFKSVQFPTIGFVGKFRRFIGDPSKGFTAMVFGRPKMGKSFWCIDFAGYLAHNHGRVIYIAKEEGLDYTLQEKLKAQDVAHENLDVADHIPAQLDAYEYIFIDSVNSLKLSTADLQTLKRNNPGKNFIYVFQTTKDGNFRGANEFQHDVDFVVEVPERGRAVQYGRFNQGAEMNIFSDSNSELEGRPAQKKNKRPIQNIWPDTQYLTDSDLDILEQVKRYYDQGDMEMAMYMAMRGETEVRDAIPPDIWKKMGGMLTPTGEEKLRKMQGK